MKWGCHPILRVKMLRIRFDIATTTGVSSVMISEYDRTSIYPDNETFDIDKDKSFNFSGMFTAGQFEFLDDDALFEYEPYHFISDSLNELRMDVLYNNPNSASNLLRVKSVIEGADIVVSVNSPDNHQEPSIKMKVIPKLKPLIIPKFFILIQASVVVIIIGIAFIFRQTPFR